MRAPFRESPISGDPEDFSSPEPLMLVVFPTDHECEPVLYDPDGKPLYRPQMPFGFCRPEETA